MRILNVSFKVISILESFALDFKNLAALGAKVSLALFDSLDMLETLWQVFSVIDVLNVKTIMLNVIKFNSNLSQNFKT